MADTLTAVGAAMACIRDALDGKTWRTNDPIVADVAHRVGTMAADHNAYRDKAREWRELWTTCDAKREAAADTWSAHGYRNALVWASRQVVEWPGTITERDALYQLIAAGPAQPVEGDK